MMNSQIRVDKNYCQDSW